MSDAPAPHSITHAAQLNGDAKDKKKVRLRRADQAGPTAVMELRRGRARGNDDFTETSIHRRETSWT
eukprot:scaffold332398_cov36-Cyclotella_meneghiniana.AAC.2